MPPHAQCLFYFTVHFMLSLSPWSVLFLFPCLLFRFHVVCSSFLRFDLFSLFFVPFSFVLLLVSLCVLFLFPFPWFCSLFILFIVLPSFCCFFLLCPSLRSFFLPFVVFPFFCSFFSAVRLFFLFPSLCSFLRCCLGLLLLSLSLWSFLSLALRSTCLVQRAMQSHDPKPPRTPAPRDS